MPARAGADRERDDGDETPTLTPEEAMQQLESVGIPVSVEV